MKKHQLTLTKYLGIMPHDHPMSGIKAQFVLPGQTAPDNQSHLALAKVAQSLSVQIITEIP